MSRKIDKIPILNKVEKLLQNKQAIVFVVCILIASTLWFLNALSKPYSTTISYPVKFVNAPKNQFIANTPVDKLELKVDAYGFTLLRHKLSLSLSPIIFSISNITSTADANNGVYNISSNQLNRFVSSQISNEITVREINPEIITLVLDSLKTKEIAVAPNIDLQFKPQFKLKKSVRIQPETAKITGPAAIVDTLSGIYTEKKVFENIDSDFKQVLKLVVADKITIQPELVEVSIEVEKFTEKELNVPITIQNKPENIIVKLFPSEVKVNFLVGLSEFESITPASFVFGVDYESLNSNSNSANITLSRVPENIEMLRFTPNTVEFLIESNN
jgi:YbbR domain-containing protein